MNPFEDANTETHWEHITETKFYEPRTIPAGWDMSEFLPMSVAVSSADWLDLKDDYLKP
jgi:hypothetical protein